MLQFVRGTTPAMAKSELFQVIEEEQGHNFDYRMGLEIAHQKKAKGLRAKIEKIEEKIPEKAEEKGSSSWEMTTVPKRHPKDVLLQPDRRLHEKHVRKLDSFLLGVESSPKVLVDSVNEKRKQSYEQEDCMSL
ncbi:unnamed protein product [Effrenium voratum]|nr:unnamed protein product [Effrenium voratum]